jgi:hypothetical protein
MTAFNIKTVVAVGASAYGVGKSIKEAERNLRRHESKAKVRAYRFYECEASELKFECGVDLNIYAPRLTCCARLEVEQ